MEPEYIDDSRRMWKYLIFSFLTFGIYGLYFMWKMVRDINVICGYVEKNDRDRSPSFIVVILLSVLTFGIYYYFWYYRQGNRLQKAGLQYQVQISENGWSYLLWYLLFWFGGLIGFSLFIHNVNELAEKYNERIASGSRDLSDNVDNKPESPEIRSWGRNPEKKDGRKDRYDTDLPSDTFSEIGMSPALEGISGQYRGAVITLRPDEPLEIGRNPEICNLVIEDGNISRWHCTVIFKTFPVNAFYVTDHSSLGTYLNGTMRLEKERVIYCPVGSKLTLAEGNNSFLLKTKKMQMPV